MRKPSTDLFVLIKSMSADEKRFFKLFSRQFRNTKKVTNLALFELVEKQKCYDEAALKAAFSDTLSANQFAVAKNYLYNSLLRALAHYLGERGGAVKIRQQLRMVEVLYQKELLDQCEKVMQRVEGMVKKYDHPGLIQEVQEWRLRLWNKRYFDGVSAAEMAQMQADVTANLARLEHATRCCQLNYGFMYLLRTQGYLHSPEEARALFAEILSDPVLRQTGVVDSTVSRIPQLYTLGLYELMIGNISGSHRHFLELIGLLEKSPDVGYDYFDFYISVQYNYGTVCLYLDDYEEVGRTIHKIEQSRAAFAAQKARMFYCSFLLNIEYTVGTLQFEKALAITAKARADLAIYGPQLSAAERVSVCFTIAFVYFSHGDHRETHRLIQEEMSPDLLAVLPDLRVVVLMLKVILYYEMEEFELFSQACRTLYRFLLKRKPRFRLESLVLKAVRQSSSLDSPQDLRDFFINFRRELVELRTDPKEGRTVQYFNFFAWLDSKIMGISILDVIRTQLLEAKKEG